jgi:hypothetical protein
MELTGTIENGMDLMQWRHDSRPLQKEKTKSKNCSRNRLFHSKKIATTKKFYETLKLKANEIELFLQFCEADPKSK